MVKLMSGDVEDYIREKLVQGEFQTREAFFEVAVRLYCELEIRRSAHRKLRKRVKNIAGIKAQLGSEFSDSC
jgi:hypothetical protein